ncbi:hypothetical protein ES708_16620 [subsurface metagenome]
MAKKLTIFDREKLLKARERGLTDSEIKAQFGITDDRTLRRHLKLAGQEQETRIAKTEIVKEALRDHLAEIRQLIEGWKGGIRIPSVTDPIITMGGSMNSHNRLFACLKDHLPFPILWRDYNQWEAKYRSYTDNCKKLREEIQREATTQMKLDFAPDTSNFSHFTSGLQNWIFALVRDKLEGQDVKKVEFYWPDLKISVKGGVLEGKQMLVGKRELLEIINQSEIDTEFYEKGCQALLDSCLSSETVANLSTLLDDLHNLEPKIHNSLEEILLRRDYILYTCNLCPGKPRLLR